MADAETTPVLKPNLVSRHEPAHIGTYALPPVPSVGWFGAMLAEWTMVVRCEGVVESSACVADWCCHWWRCVWAGCSSYQRGRRRIRDTRSDRDDADIDAQLNHPHVACCAGYNDNVFDSAAPTHDNNWTCRFDHATFDNGGHHHDIATSW